MGYARRVGIISVALAALAAPAYAAPKPGPLPASAGFAVLVDGPMGGGGRGGGGGGLTPGQTGALGGAIGGLLGGILTQPQQAPPPYQPPYSEPQQAPPAYVPPATPGYVPNIGSSPSPGIFDTPYADPPPARRAPPKAPPQPAAISTVIELSGEVTVISNGGPERKIRSGHHLRKGDQINTGVDAQAKVRCPDGSVVRINEMTQILVDELAVRESRMNMQVQLKLGELAAKMNRNKEFKTEFKVGTPMATTSSRGTEFRVRHDKRTGVTTVSVQESAVLVEPKNTALQPVLLHVGQQVELTADRIGPITGPGAPAAVAAATAAPASGNLSGAWVTDDGRVLQVVQDGAAVSWDYTGRKGHESMAGKVTATFDGRNLVGTFKFREGSSEGSGIVSYTLDGNRLDGFYSLSGKPDQKYKASLTRHQPAAAAATLVSAVPAVPTPANLNGAWVTDDGRVLKVVQDGAAVSWDYTGRKGHESLAGKVTATFDGRNLVGTYKFREGSSEGSGIVSYALSGNRLDGFFTSPNNLEQKSKSVLTRQ